LRNSQFESSAKFSGYRPIHLQLALLTNLTASPSNRSPTCVFNLSPALPSSLNFKPFTDCQILQQIFRSISSSRLRPSFRSNLRASLWLAPLANSSVPLSSRPATVATCRSSSHALQSSSSLRLPSIIRLNLPVSLFDLRLLGTFGFCFQT